MSCSFRLINCHRAITRDEAKYPSPEEFKPERFFGVDGELNDDTMSYAFGAGRRICQSVASIMFSCFNSLIVTL